jgi:hypothetical protein
MSQTGADGNYVRSITTQDGFTLAEFDNGPTSGWMYLVKRGDTITHPPVGLKAFAIEDGDIIIWHYVHSASPEESAKWETEAVVAGGFPDDDAEPPVTDKPTVTPPPPEKPVKTEPVTDTFADVPAGEWYVDAVQYAVNNKLMAGVGENEFAPEETLTRAMVATILYSHAGKPAVSGGSPFEDLTEDWYKNAVSWAVAKGVVSGTSAATFAPDAEITRQDFALILKKYAALCGKDTSARAELSAFADAGEIADYAEAALQWAVSAGLMSGRSPTRLAPQGTATRAEAAQLLMSFLEKVL